MRGRKSRTAHLGGGEGNANSYGKVFPPQIRLLILRSASLVSEARYLPG